MPHSERLVRPSTSTPQKHHSRMSLNELREAAFDQELEHLRLHANHNPNDDASQAAYRNACLLRGLDADTGRPSRLNTLSNEQLVAEWETAGKSQGDAELEKYRDGQANLFLASQPHYEANPENAKRMIAELDRQELRGSIHDLNLVYETLVSRGEIQPKFIPELDRRATDPGRPVRDAN